MTPKLLLPLLCLTLFCACGDAEIGNSKDVNPETVYIKYRVTYNENEPMVTLRAQFAFAGPNGTTLVLNNPAKVELDGDSIHVDSTAGEGAFYEVQKPAATFTGNHTLVFTGNNGVKYTQPFVFSPVQLTSTIPAAIGRDGFPLTFSGLAPTDSLNIRIKDTSSSGTELDTMLYVANNQTVVSRAMLAKLKPGPLTIKIAGITPQPMPNTTKEGGEFTVWYVLNDRKTVLAK